ncbi:hypothetical protein BGX38DRAFT_628311 [Terfezia claveryi]|nr:hypothetical protein BGX38DRAFT_628311 [Terfezia claveryi]
MGIVVILLCMEMGTAEFLPWFLVMCDPNCRVRDYPRMVAMFTVFDDPRPARVAKTRARKPQVPDLHHVDWAVERS